ncbi:nicotinamide riboside transporter PnuC [Roseateles sp. BYS78W]|uniref:Nicotinamide riboside transporter PnuC n=1 Tax=Pelomonas candidula TaxID=3299025 RepID=A0ABW7HEI9_9BURK
MLAALWAALLAPAFTAFGSPITWLELAAFVLSVWMVVCNMRVNPLAWPLALIASLMYFALFLDGKLYGEAALQLVFAALAVWGWWQWRFGRTREGDVLTVRRLGLQGLAKPALLTLAAWPLLGVFLARFTDSPLPWWDAFPTVASLLGQWLLARKYEENWPTWIVVNTVSVVLFGLKGYWLTVILYAGFIPMSVVGWRAWQRA